MYRCRPFVGAESMRAVPTDRSYRRQVWEGGCDFVQPGWIQMVEIVELDYQML
jgi:hypothetical protein